MEYAPSVRDSLASSRAISAPMRTSRPVRLSEPVNGAAIPTTVLAGSVLLVDESHAPTVNNKAVHKIINGYLIVIIVPLEF